MGNILQKKLNIYKRRIVLVSVSAHNVFQVQKTLCVRVDFITVINTVALLNKKGRLSYCLYSFMKTKPCEVEMLEVSYGE